MKVGELIEQLEKYNSDAKVHVIAHCKSFDFSICIGGSEGVTKETTKEVNFYVDTLCQNEHLESENCWCCPTVEEYENGNKVIIHNEPN